MKENRNKLILFKSLLILQTVGLAAYTVAAVQNDGGNFLLKALGFATSMTWMGQFTLDFGCYLVLSGIWILWRNKCAASSIPTALLASIFGIIFFAPYLLYLVWKTQGDLKAVLVGDR